MKQFTILFVVLAGLLSSIHLAEAYDDSDLQRVDNWKVGSRTQLTINDVTSIQVVRSEANGDSRLFQRTDGYEERVIKKVIKWINSSSPIKVAAEVGLDKIPLILKLTLSNKDIAFIEPVYNCVFKSSTRTCTAVDGQILYTRNNLKVRLVSQELYDWLLVGWKYEIDGPSKEELLEETLYTRYFPDIGKAFPDFIMCPRINSIERINGDTRRHVVNASALNYAGHHASSYEKINFTLIDTPEHGVKIIKVIRQKNISEKESLEQCR